MLFTVMQVLYVVVAIIMVVFILMQRGSGSRGSANFLSRSTAILCGLFFLLSVGMAAHIAHSGRVQKTEELSLMERRALQASEVPVVTPPADAPAAGTATDPSAAPAAATEGAEAPAAPPAAEAAPVSPPSEAPASTPPQSQ
ncbi:MAG: preprotein translocase subunit SecG [Xanthomonadales bacterium]|nr:preprotein translocase subunit SecG [Xanthomonadales bacterium]